MAQTCNLILLPKKLMDRANCQLKQAFISHRHEYFPMASFLPIKKTNYDGGTAWTTYTDHIQDERK